MFNNRKYETIKGFSIVELLVVIAIIGILTTIAVVGYPGVVKNAVNSSLKGDLDNVSKQIKSFQTSTIANGKYPIRIDDCPTPASGNLCIKSNGSNKLSYTPNNNVSPKNFRVTSYNEEQGFYYSNDANDIKCPLNFVIVPGSSLYGTNDFCAMKYEAKQNGATVPISKADGLPWANVPQDLSGLNNDAIEYSKNVADCRNCHLISEPEWMTLAHDALSVGANWSSGTVGSGTAYRGHSDSSPSSTIPASKKDVDTYSGTGNSGDTQRRTLTLSNGEVIWDIAGNASEWTSGKAAGSAANIPENSGLTCNAANGGTFTQWTNLTSVGSLVPSPRPIYMSDFSGIGSWDSSYGIGMLCSSISANWTRGFVRGGNQINGTIAGTLSLSIYQSADVGNGYIGFRAAR